MTDPIADMLTRIRNAAAVRKPEIVLPFSNIKFAVAQVLEKENYVAKVDKIKTGNNYEIKIVLKYKDKDSVIHHIRRVSTPGRRVYISGKEIPKILNGYGQAIISTSRGIMTGAQASKANIGGEFMCEIW